MDKSRRDFLKLLGLAPIAAKLGLEATKKGTEEVAGGYFVPPKFADKLEVLEDDGDDGLSAAADRFAIPSYPDHPYAKHWLHWLQDDILVGGPSVFADVDPPNLFADMYPPNEKGKTWECEYDWIGRCFPKQIT